MKARHQMTGAVLMIACVVAAGSAVALTTDRNPVERGKYLVSIAGCNDCHTPGYMEKEGDVQESLWMTGDSFGWRGPWGTTYPPNLRLLVQDMTEDQWVALAKNLRSRPPMPWFNLKQMDEVDIRAIYSYLRYLGPAGVPAPAYLPPDQVPTTPHVNFSPPPS